MLHLPLPPHRTWSSFQQPPPLMSSRQEPRSRVLSTVKEIKERTKMLHKRMDLIKAELRHQRDDTAGIRKELRLKPYHRRRPASSA
ncbi:hypothetical protein QYF36_004534 [Acer negundo]|nr:hypothetical protein QYF36_004534 [Acer negundo]